MIPDILQHAWSAIQDELTASPAVYADARAEIAAVVESMYLLEHWLLAQPLLAPVPQANSVLYNGIPMHTAWPAVLEAAQQQTHVMVDGLRYPRVAFGLEALYQATVVFPTSPCRDCGTAPGEFHVEMCRVEQCPACGKPWVRCREGEHGEGQAHGL